MLSGLLKKVLGLFRKKPDRAKVALDVIPVLLKLQLTLAGANAGKVTADYWALGYVFGFPDGLLQMLKVALLNFEWVKRHAG